MILPASISPVFLCQVGREIWSRDKTYSSFIRARRRLVSACGTPQQQNAVLGGALAGRRAGRIGGVGRERRRNASGRGDRRDVRRHDRRGGGASSRLTPAGRRRADAPSGPTISTAPASAPLSTVVWASSRSRDKGTAKGIVMKRTLLRTFAAAAAAAALSASGFATTAAAQSDQQPTHAELVQRWAEAALDAQLKGIKTSLRLTDDQEKDWAPFETAVKDGEKARVLALQKEQGNNLSPMGRLNAKAERLAQSQADLEKIVEAAKPLYASLSDAQKHKFIALGRMLVPERGRFAMEMRHLRVGEGDRHVALAAIGGKSAPSEAASTPATATAGTNGAKSAPSAAPSAPDAATPGANGTSSAPSQAASTPATTTPGANGAKSTSGAAASAPDAATSEANGATSAPSRAASTPATTTPRASGAMSTPSAVASAPEAATLRKRTERRQRQVRRRLRRTRQLPERAERRQRLERRRFRLTRRRPLLVEQLPDQLERDLHSPRRRRQPPD